MYSAWLRSVISRKIHLTRIYLAKIHLILRNIGRRKLSFPNQSYPLEEIISWKHRKKKRSLTTSLEFTHVPKASPLKRKCRKKKRNRVSNPKFTQFPKNSSLKKNLVWKLRKKKPPIHLRASMLLLYHLYTIFDWDLDFLNSLPKGKECNGAFYQHLP